MLIVANADKAADVASALQPVQNIAKPSPPIVKDGVALIAANLKVDATSPAAYTAVRDVRDAVGAVPGAQALVGGGSAIQTDIEKASGHDNRVIIPLVLLVVMLILMVLLRAVLSPLILVATVVLSFGASLGLSALLFRHVLGFAGADASLPLFVFVFLVALGIDYNIFLMTRVREETPAHGTRQASLIAPGRHRRGDHLGRHGAGRDLPRAGHVAAGRLRRDRHRGRARRPARHAGGPLGAGHRDQPRRRRADLVAEPPRPGPARRAATRSRARTPGTAPTYRSTRPCDARLARAPDGGFMTVTRLLSRS